MISTTVLEDIGSSQGLWKIDRRKAIFVTYQEGIAFAAVAAASSANQLVTPERRCIQPESAQ
ncbi:hypothetical protein N7489_007087 [Penicillium chrysogenum]|jgi:hypothetical protein|uniref:Uncharacterized protein n=1 Tax=Penicillium chrysogenum TaxID=5076 RepID=A0ABQ8W5P3_PENCH|nr:uncharacterized protein N7489_007087 [Penicillium chrysogenum]KAJ5236996.1 hypothetical protein N7489_007087 [Penicillium chrysogenum]KAJ5255936.1 hypothetical protein N7505_011087 [Penicillium chrysogenum]KAJ5276959.1 hypothetical protein N7524_003112 [Penicillium chrysogenum]KAJ6152300.1 hypothetical protein N7497_006619 [Penicillium chrysogenum]